MNRFLNEFLFYHIIHKYIYSLSQIFYIYYNDYLFRSIFIYYLLLFQKIALEYKVNYHFIKIFIVEKKIKLLKKHIIKLHIILLIAKKTYNKITYYFINC